MITVSHKLDENGRQYQTVTNPDYRTYGHATATYAVGWTKPNHPVPVTSNVAATMLFADSGEFSLASDWY